ncbi:MULTISPECIES: DUF1048 domain-containing protein [Enterococcus]|uniref:Uncharacterized protein n=1 Tax=Enterococcus sulfureus ATCC 49903 TaxID=1140003 RepID=S0PGJ5_9ENTE|nr:DUF1048 domain-containing protein [Enterococcus sulfureus]EOT48669.1 hypothetical protein OMY_00624 [Enterococcus sulfureus ATCC 49903]EOT87561.1 hypothetical protein I573_00617 [Enterococcus sulfureus ATCC 49903]
MDPYHKFTINTNEQKLHLFDERAQFLSDAYANEWIETKRVINHYVDASSHKKVLILEEILHLFERSDAKHLDLVAVVENDLRELVERIATKYVEKLYD